MGSSPPYGRAARARGIRRRVNHEQQRRRHQVSELLSVENLNQREIAERLGISQATVSRDLRAIEREWRAENPGFVDKWKKTLIARANREHRLALDAFQRSMGTKTTNRQEQELVPELDAAGNPVRNPDGSTRMVPSGRSRAVVERQVQVGDAKFLSEMHKRNLEIGKIVGAYPLKSIFSEPPGGEGGEGDEPGTVPDVLVIRVPRRKPAT